MVCQRFQEERAPEWLLRGRRHWTEEPSPDDSCKPVKDVNKCRGANRSGREEGIFWPATSRYRRHWQRRHEPSWSRSPRQCFGSQSAPAQAWMCTSLHMLTWSPSYWWPLEPLSASQCLKIGCKIVSHRISIQGVPKVKKRDLLIKCWMGMPMAI